MKPGFFYALLLLGALFGSPYAAAILNSAMGPWSADAYHADGTVSHMEFGLHLPRPDWVPVPRDATLVQAARVTSATQPTDFHTLDLMTRQPLDEIKRFYTTQLQAAGFAVTDLGLGPLNPAAAQFLGIDGTLQGERAATHETVAIQIRSPEGVVAPARLLQIQWHTAAVSAHAGTR
jgi:hypothetical protein